MAERNVSVKLTARTETYIAAMKKAEAATTGLASTGGRDLTRLGGQFQSFGRAATLGVTVPLVALGAGAVGMAAKFEQSFAMMQGLASVPASELDSLKESVLDLAGETAIAPQELAEALYMLRSSGLDGAEAMDALEMSAMASAAGLGDTATIADAVSSAMNAYAASGLTAAEATDILVATARAGKAEPTELAAALGRVLPIASELGITFEDVGGALAALSLNGNDASTSSTLLTNVMSKLLKPSQQGAKALAEVGLSTQAIRQSIAEDGLLPTLQMLQDKLGDSGFIRFMEDAQAVQGALTLVNDASGNVAGAFDIVKEAAGGTAQAFAAMSETDAMKMKQALVDLQVAMVKLGTILLPVAAQVGTAISSMVGWFADLDPAAQSVILAFAGVAAAAGPLMIVAGSLIKNIGLIKTAVAGLSTVSASLLAIGAVIGVAFLAYQDLTKQSRETDEVTRNVSAALDGQVASLFSVAGAARTTGDDINGLAIANEALSLALAEGNTALADALASLNVSAAETLDILAMYANDPQAALESLAESFGLTAGQAQGFADVVMNGGDDIFRNIDTWRQGMRLNEGQIDALTTAWFAFNDAAKDTDLQAIAREFLDGRVKAEGFTGSLVAAAESNLGFTRSTGDALAVYREWATIVGEADAATMAAASGADELTGSMGAMGPTLQESSTAVDALNSALPQSERVMMAAAEATGKWIDGLSVASTESKALAGAVDDLNSALPQSERVMMAAAAAAGKWIDGFPVASTEAKGLAGAVDDLGGKASDAAYGLDDLRGAVDELFASFLQATDPADKMREAIRQVWAEAENMETAMYDASEAGLTLGEAFELGTETGRSNQEQLESSRDAIYENAAAMMEGGASAEEAAGDIAFNTAALRTHLLSVYNDEAAVDALIATYFRTPEQIATDLELIGVGQAAAEIASHKGRLNSIAPNKNTVITASASGVGAVENALNYAARNRTSRITVFTSSVAGTSTLGSAWGGSGRAHGGFIGSPEISLIGEAGNEAVFPLTNPARMRALWGDPRISGPMTSALAVPTSSGAMSGEVHHHYNANVSNNGRDLTSDDLVRAFSQLRRSA